MSTHVPVFRTFYYYFLHPVVLAKLATSSIRVNVMYNNVVKLPAFSWQHCCTNSVCVPRPKLWSEVWPLIISSRLQRRPGFQSCSWLVRKFPMTWGYVWVCPSLLHDLSVSLAMAEKQTIFKIPKANQISNCCSGKLLLYTNWIKSAWRFSGSPIDLSRDSLLYSHCDDLLELFLTELE